MDRPTTRVSDARPLMGQSCRYVPVCSQQLLLGGRVHMVWATSLERDWQSPGVRDPGTHNAVHPVRSATAEVQVSPIGCQLARAAVSMPLPGISSAAA
jgi:hypothetical protein